MELGWFSIFFKRLFCLIVTNMMLLINTSATTIYEFLQRIFSEHLRSFKKTDLVDSTGFITIILKTQRFVSFV